MIEDNQLLTEYRRLLTAYRHDCIVAQSALSAEIETVTKALAENLRFAPRYSLLDFAGKVTAMTAKMHLFSNLSMKV